MMQRLVGAPTIRQDGGGNLAGTFQRAVWTDDWNAQPDTGKPTSPFDQPVTVSFTLAKGVIASCTSDAQCVTGAHCDLGLCSTGPNHRFAFSLGAWPTFLHKRMYAWGWHWAGLDAPNGFLGYYLPGSYARSQVLSNRNGGYRLTAPLPGVSGEPSATLFSPQGGVAFSALPPIAIPLLTQHDNSWVTPGSQLLSSCLADLARDPRSPTSQ